MTREEAIKYLSPIAKSARPANYKTALEMALSALRAQQEPIKLDRSKWEGCEWCKTYGFGAVVFDGQKYCGYCGRPLTEEAWAELERRIGGNDEKTNIK